MPQRRPRLDGQVTTHGNRSLVFDKGVGHLQRSPYVVPGLLAGIAFNAGHDQTRPAWRGPTPGLTIHFPSPRPHRLALSAQHVQHAIAGGRNNLDGKIDAQQPGNVIDFGHQLASAASLAVKQPESAKSLQGLHVGERRKDWAVDAEIAGDFVSAQAADGKHHVGLVQRPMDENRFARLAGSQIGQLPPIGRIVGQMGDPLAQWRGDQPAGIAAPHIELGRILQHGDAIGIQARFDQGVDDRRRDTRQLGHAAIEGQHDPIGRRDAEGQIRVVDRFCQRADRGGVEIGQRLAVRRAHLGGRVPAGEFPLHARIASVM